MTKKARFAKDTLYLIFANIILDLVMMKFCIMNGILRYITYSKFHLPKEMMTRPEIMLRRWFFNVYLYFTYFF